MLHSDWIPKPWCSQPQAHRYLGAYYALPI